MSSPKRRARGEGSLSQRKNGMWVASIPTGEYDAKGRPKRKQVSSMDYDIAVQKLRQLQRDLEDGVLSTINHTTTVSQWLDTWLDTIVKPTVKPTTLGTYRAECSAIKNRIGGKRLAQLTPQMVRKMLADVADEQSTGTALNLYRRLSKALGDAKRDGLIRDNVCERVPAPRVTRANRGSHDSESARKIIAHLIDTEDVDELSRWSTSLFTGVRQAEAIGLTWDRVDFETGQLDITWTLQRLPLVERYKRPADPLYPRTMFDVAPGIDFTPVWRAWCLIDTKTRGSQRIVPMVPPLQAALKAHHDELGNPATGLVWQREGGRPWSKQSDEQRWKDMLASAGVNELTQHSARHTVATLLQEAGVPESTRMAILGHSSTAMARHYAHVDVSLARDALGKLDTLLSGESSAAAG
ncbi:tyrosine-type recombinase/integrase [Gordonia sp. (in: high G+C Gram-positive bacteria)]|uniref:tyrosine-type recombinase/integrase n=1 Tax=Gordonia sp. (in: high G+C Gram-positive bacteria) TaxID=84139 RepID=UPI003F9AC655